MTGPLRLVALLITLAAFAAHLGLCSPGHQTGEPAAGGLGASVLSGPDVLLEAPDAMVTQAGDPHRPAGPSRDPVHARHAEVCQTFSPARAGLGMAVKPHGLPLGPAGAEGVPVTPALSRSAAAGSTMLTLLCVWRT